jgi:hypothetical protein
VAGAGNDATNKLYFPAADRGVIIAEGRSGPEAARHVLQARGAPRIDNLGTIVAPGVPTPA